MNLIDSLIEEGWLKTPRIIEAFRKIKRVDFLPREIKDLAELNEALSIGYGQTISQPLVVAFMLELLDPQPGNKILDIGSGTGWTTALLAQIVGQKGKVIAIDIIPELVEFGKQNVAKYNFIEKGLPAACLPDRQGRQVKKIDFASERLIKNKFKGVKVGATPPFGNLWGLRTFIDNSLMKEKEIILNGGDYNFSIKISSNQLKKILPDAIFGNFSEKKK